MSKVVKGSVADELVGAEKFVQVPVIDESGEPVVPEPEPEKPKALAGYVKVPTGPNTFAWWCVKGVLNHPENVDAFTRKANKLGLEWKIGVHGGEPFKDWPPVGPNGVGRGVPGAGVGVAGGAWE